MSKKQLYKEMSNGERLDALSNWIFTDTDDLGGNPSDQQAPTLLLPDGSSWGSGEDVRLLDEMGDVPDIENFQFGIDIDSESYTPTNSDISRGGGEKKEVIFTYEDWEEEEQLAVHLMTMHVRNCFLINISAKRRTRSMEFVFSNLCDDDEINFLTCCEILQVRECVLKARLHFEYFIRWVIVHDMPFLTLPPDEELLSEVGFTAGFTGVEICKLAWLQPGVTEYTIIERLCSMYQEKHIKQAIALLQKSGHLAVRGENNYFTGRNPEKNTAVEIQRSSKQSNFRWSTLW